MLNLSRDGKRRRQYYCQTTGIVSDVRKEVASPGEERGVFLLTANTSRLSTAQALVASGTAGQYTLRRLLGT